MNKEKLEIKYYFLLILPVVLITSTAFVFFVFSNVLGNDLGYVIGFSLYYIIWCYGIPLILIGKDGFVS